MRWHTSIVGQLGKTTQFRQQITQFRTFFSHDLTKNHYPSSKSVSFMPNSLSRTLTSPQAATSQKTCRSFLYATNPEKIQKKQSLIDGQRVFDVFSPSSKRDLRLRYIAIKEPSCIVFCIMTCKSCVGIERITNCLMKTNNGYSEKWS